MSHVLDCTVTLRRGVDDRTVTGEYVDAGVSGAKNARPALDELVAATMAGEVEVVVIAKLDRLGRSLQRT